jgi:3-isopropylmalate/(R)-2-methylmalate dehydratase large subunit
VSCRRTVTAKDIVLALISKVGTGGGQGYIAEYRGSAIRDLPMEGRMTICNMSIEWGAKAGMIAPTRRPSHTSRVVRTPPRAPTGTPRWSTGRPLHTDDDAVFATEVYIDATKLTPFVTWGTNPGQGVGLDASVPDPRGVRGRGGQGLRARALEYMGLTAGTPMRGISVDTVFLGSCTNGRIEDLRLAAGIIKGHKVADGVRMLVVPGSARVREQAMAEGLDEIFLQAGAEWREAGCSMCLGMNPDQLGPGRAFGGPPATATSKDARARAERTHW